MRRKLVVATLALAALGSSAATARAPKAIGIAEREYRISTYVWKVKPGPVKLNVSNFGQDTHNLVVQGPKGYRAKGPATKPASPAPLPAPLKRPGPNFLPSTR